MPFPTSTIRYYPDKPTWAVADDFGLFFGRQARQRQYALALTRGINSIGTTFLAAPNGPEAKPQTVADQKELYAWIHKHGGAYAKTQPLPAIGVLYVHDQALLRRVNQNADAPDAELLKGAHEGKTTEALWLCHAAGWPAKIITPEELRRGLPPSMKAILLVGLNDFDDTWHWHDGLGDALKKFTAGGGRVLLDDESVVPAGIAATQTGLAMRSYITQNDVDQTPKLFARNTDNISKLRVAMTGIAAPFVVSDEPTIWAIPHQTGDVQYATVVNWGYEDGKNASQVVKPQTGTLKWNTTRPIYDVRLGRKLTAGEARQVDLTKDGFALYALPPVPVTKPNVRVARDQDGFPYATVLIGAGRPLSGIPIQVTVTANGETSTVYGASGNAIPLPLDAKKPRAARVEVTELLSGLSNFTLFTPRLDSPAAATATTPLASTKVHPLAVSKFTWRTKVPLTIALTSEQAKDATTKRLAEFLKQFYSRQGRTVSIGIIEPNGVIESLQPLNPTRHFPQWKTIDADLVLLGNPRDNILLFDQMRGDLLPAGAMELRPGQVLLDVAYSPFVGEYQALNILAPDAAGLAAGVAALTK